MTTNGPFKLIALVILLGVWAIFTYLPEGPQELMLDSQSADAPPRSVVARMQEAPDVRPGPFDGADQFSPDEASSERQESSAEAPPIAAQSVRAQPDRPAFSEAIASFHSDARDREPCCGSDAELRAKLQAHRIE